MKISELFGKGKTILSFEVFPPKKTMPVDTIYETLDGLKDLNPAFISVTYGAGGNAADRTTCEIAPAIKHKYGIESAAHLTCVNNSREDILKILGDFKECGVENILALRGDINPNVPPKDDFKYASDLISYLKDRGDFHISAACYPDSHLDSPDIITDI